MISMQEVLIQSRHTDFENKGFSKILQATYVS